MAGGATESYRYDPNGDRVQRVSNTTAISAYHGAWQEWTNGVGRSTNYVFGGRVVAQRNTSSGAVTFLIGDHLGSVSATTNLSGVRQSVQYFDPWGKIRSGNVQASTFNYTGQRRDDTGLLYYNARYYDPSRGQFVSSDSVVADLSNPATLNRYAYGFNNPLRYTDPTGHCNVDGTDGDDAVACADQVDQLGEYGVTVGDFAGGLWSLLDLTTMRDALKQFANAFGWDIAQFREKIGDVLVHQVRTETTKSLLGQNPAVAWPHPAEDRTHILFAQDAMYDSAGNFNAAFFTRTVIHEFAHAWDFQSGGGNSARLIKDHRARIEAGDRSGKMTPYGTSNRFERWAEAVTFTVLQTDEVDDAAKARVRERAAR